MDGGVVVEEEDAKKAGSKAWKAGGDTQCLPY